MAASIRFRRSGTTAAARCASSALVLTLPGTSHVNGARHAIVAHLFIMPLVEETAFLLALTTHTSATSSGQWDSGATCLKMLDANRVNGARRHRKREEGEAALTWTAMLSLPSALAPISHFTNPPYLHATYVQVRIQEFSAYRLLQALPLPMRASAVRWPGYCSLKPCNSVTT